MGNEHGNRIFEVKETVIIQCQRCNELFKIEKKLNSLIPKDRLTNHQEEIKPVLDAFGVGLKNLIL